MLKALARFILWLGGWKIIGRIPAEPKAVIVAAPHTSNWDGLWALSYKAATGIDVKFFAKHSLFWFPLGALLRWLGGIPLDRSRATSAVSQAVEMFNAKDSFYFALAPEGTRALRESWKNGFYRIAESAHVPVYFGVIDYGRKHIGISDRLELTGDVAADLGKCAEFYRDVKGRWPEKQTPVRFVE